MVERAVQTRLSIVLLKLLNGVQMATNAYALDSRNHTRNQALLALLSYRFQPEHRHDTPNRVYRLFLAACAAQGRGLLGMTNAMALGTHESGVAAQSIWCTIDRT